MELFRRHLIFVLAQLCCVQIVASANQNVFLTLECPHGWIVSGSTGYEFTGLVSSVKKVLSKSMLLLTRLPFNFYMSMVLGGDERVLHILCSLVSGSLSTSSIPVLIG